MIKWLRAICAVACLAVTVLNVWTMLRWEKVFKADAFMSSLFELTRENTNPYRTDKENAEFALGVAMGQQSIELTHKLQWRHERYWYSGVSLVLFIAFVVFDRKCRAD